MRFVNTVSWFFLFSVGSNRGGGKVGQRVWSLGMGTIFLRKIRAIEAFRYAESRHMSGA
jgi:hypothetical protein